MKRIMSFIVAIVLILCFSSITFATAPEIYDLTYPDAMNGINKEHKHISRAFENEDDLCMLAFNNIDGTVSCYYFAEPVKYINNENRIVDKSTSLHYTNMGFINENDFKVIAPQLLSDGINVIFKDYSVRTTINNIDYTYTAKQNNSNSIVYESLDNNISFKYTALLNGLKEEIIIEEPVDFLQFSFSFETNGLSLRQYDNTYYFCDDMQPVFRMSEIVFFDAKNTFVDLPCDLTVTTIIENELYRFNLCVNMVDISTQNISFPLIIDPTITLNDNTTIEDTTLFENQADQNYGNYNNIRVGYYNSNYGQSYTIIKFPGLENSVNYSAAFATEITSAKLYLYSKGQHTVSTWAQVNYYTGSPWLENTITYTSAVYPFSSPSTMGLVSIAPEYTGYIEFNVLLGLQAWKNGTVLNGCLEKGFCIVGSTLANSCLNLRSSEASSNKPYIVITFSNSLSLPLMNAAADLFYIKNVETGRYLNVENGLNQNANNVNQYDGKTAPAHLWKIEHVSNGEYKIVSQNGDNTKVLTINNSNNATINAFSASSNQLFKIYRKSNLYSFVIVSKSSNYQKALCVNDSNIYSNNANVEQETYQNNTREEWILEPYNNLSLLYGSTYAIATYNSYISTYPNLTSWGGDCTNFVSQCLLANGIHFINQWHINKLNNNNMTPLNSTQLDSSWSLETVGWPNGSSPWISAPRFKDFWNGSQNISCITLTASDILNMDVNSYTYGAGDVIQLANSNGNPTHSLYITGFVYNNGQKTYRVAMHTDNYLLDLITVAENNPDKLFIFYSFH